MHLVQARAFAYSGAVYPYRYNRMMLKRRFNAVYRDYPPYRTGDLVGVLANNAQPELEMWLGVIDRRVARQMPDAVEVFLDFEAYRLSLLDKTQWLGPNVAVVGCKISEGVLAVTDGKKPLVKGYCRGSLTKPAKFSIQNAPSGAWRPHSHLGGDG